MARNNLPLATLTTLAAVVAVLAVTAAAKPEVGVSTICEVTKHKEACEHSLRSVSNTSDPREFIKAAIESAGKAIKASLELSRSMVGKAKDPKVKMTVEDCKDLLTYADQSIAASQDTVRTHESAHALHERVPDLRTWLSAILSYSETCTEGVQQNEFKSTIQNGVVNATQLTSNALAIVTHVHRILAAEHGNLKFHAKKDVGHLTARRVEEEPVSGSTEVDDDGIDDDGNPIWVPGGKEERQLHMVPNDELRPNTIVAVDGTGVYKSINDALKAVPRNNPNRYIIYVKAGVYKENVIVQANNVFMYGDGPRRTMVTGDRSFTAGYTTYKSSTFSARGDGFLCRDMGFQNTAGPEGHQAVSLHVQSDMAVFYKCRVDGFQDSLYLHAQRQFLRNCIVSGTVDFIFGDSSAVFQNCKLIARKGMRSQQNMYTAHKRNDANEPTGFAIHNCHLVPDMGLAPVKADVKSFLGRPWGEYARVVVMECVIADHVAAEGWMPWGDSRGQDGKVFYAEYANRGPGAGTGGRTKIFHGGVRTINKHEAQRFLVDAFIQGNKWLPATGFPFFRTLRM